jgi:hypothetical protein
MRPDPSGGLVARARVPAAVTVLAAATLIAAMPGAADASGGGTKGSGAKGASTTTTTLRPAPTSTTAPTGPSVDVLTAERDQVLAEVASFDARIRAAEAAAAEAQARVDAANALAAAAQAKADDAARKADEAAAQVRAYAVEAFVRPPAQDSLSALSIKESEDAAYATEVLEIVAERRRRVVDTMVAARKVAEQDKATAEAAAREAKAQLDAAEQQVASLRSARSAQARLASQLDDRLDRKLAEAAALTSVDSATAKDMTAKEVSLRSSGPPSPAPATPTSSAGRTTPAPAPSKPTAKPPTTTTKPPTTTPPAKVPGLVTWSDVTKVGGIWVHTSIAGQVSALLAAAKAAGFNLSGGGFRDPAEQIALRKAHCGTTDYAIYQMPASQCTPPTARPGTSMHERGLAIDFQSNGRLITSRSDPAFIWLSANAARYGFYNLPSEPWHWSTNGS